jgi:hypothetical protein
MIMEYFANVLWIRSDYQVLIKIVTQELNVMHSQLQQLELQHRQQLRHVLLAKRIALVLLVRNKIAIKKM